MVKATYTSTVENYVVQSLYNFIDHKQLLGATIIFPDL